MFRVGIIADKEDRIRELCSGLVKKGFACSIIPDRNWEIESMPKRTVDLLLIAIDGSSSNLRMWDLSQEIKAVRRLPVIVLLTRNVLDNLYAFNRIDDFVVEPWDAIEIAARVKRVLQQRTKVDGKELITCGDLVIDLAKCEVSINGISIILTFKEYELLKFLASNKGRVYTREDLLNEVWGYDFFGGDRTVDVHIRRIRSKIEDSNHAFIETVRNIGYRFKA